MACRLPGGIDSPERLWEALLRGDDLVTQIPSDRWDADDYYDSELGVPGRSVSKWGAFLDDIAGFDAEFFGITEREAIATDPQQRLLLETTWEAVEHAGVDPTTVAGSRTGVFMGVTHHDYAHLAAAAQTLEGPYGYTGTSFSLISGRVAYLLGVHGPAVTVDTACSSGLTAIHLACRSLHNGESDLALAGGVSVMLEPRLASGASASGMLSPTGRCHAFDVAADGFVSAEGCAVVMLKRLNDAVAKGDRILAVIRGSAANQDGRTVNIATPSAEAQASVYRAALAAAGADARTVGMVEAHGTGTPVGDPIEYTSLAAVYGVDGPCALGSVKTNLGHTQAAAGAVGLMKAILSVQHGVVPQNLHFNRLPESLAAVTTNLFVPQQNTTWPGSAVADGEQSRRAAVSAYGLSGTNVHAIVEQAPATSADGPADEPERPQSGGPLLYPLSSTSPAELRRTAGRLADWLAKRSLQNGIEDGLDPAVDLTDLAYTLARRRAHRPVRTSIIATDLDELTNGLRQIAGDDAPQQAAVADGDRGPVWVFSGQGSQWAGMGAELLAAEPVFAATIDELEPLIARESNFSVRQAMTAPQTVSGIERIQPTIFAVQVALAATMKSYGVTPSAVIGHSMGEVAAAVAAGALTLEDGVKVNCRRSELMSRIAGSGTMATVELPARQVLSELNAQHMADVVVSVIASPQSTVVAGSYESIRALVRAWEDRGVMAREVAVDVAAHSPQVDPILRELAEVLTDLRPMEPQVPYYSATLFDPREATELDGDYWVDNLRRPVRFGAAVQAALEDGHRVFAELSPHPLLTHAVEQTARSWDVPMAVLAGMRRQQALPHGLRRFVADLHAVGAAVDFSVLYPAGRLVDAPLPTWTRTSLLLDRAVHDSTTGAVQSVSMHPLLGWHIPPLEEQERHLWRGEVGTEAQPWLHDHRVHEVAVLPGAAYCEMALAAAGTVLGAASEVRDVSFEQMLLLDAKTPVSASATVVSPGVVEFAIDTYHEGERARRATAVLQERISGDQPGIYDIDALLSAHPHQADGTHLRAAFDAVGIHHGAAFSALVNTHTADAPANTVLAAIRLPGPLRAEQGGYQAHPALLDGCFSAVVAHPDVQRVAARGMLLPLGVHQLRAYGSTRNARYCYAYNIKAEAEGIEADLDVLDEHGTVLLSVLGLRLGTGSADTAQDHLLNQRLLTVEWQRRDLPEVAHVDAGSWMLIDTSSNGNALAASLADALKSAGAACTTMAWPQQCQHEANAAQLTSSLTEQHRSGVVIVLGPSQEVPDSELGKLGINCVRHVVRIARELPETPGEAPRLFVVTRNAATVVADDVPNLEQAGLRGLVRVIGMEHPRLRASQIDVDPDTDGEQLASQLLSASDEEDTAWRNYQWYTARLCPGPLRADERRTTTVENERTATRLQVRTPGDLESLELVALRRVPPGPGQIEVAVSASSINFADVLAAFGRCPNYEGRQPELGSEFAGVVTAVGPGVTTHRIGDRVAGAANGCWGTFILCDANLATSLPAGLQEHEAAAVGLAYATVWLGLQDLARIGPQDKVLIHSATGGVGQGAIAVARAAGAQIFATAGSEERRQLLRDWGIEHVYDSRSVTFADQIRRDTDGYGVDIVLNSLTGAAQRASLELLAFGGRFVEIGKRDIYADTRLGLFPFRRNLSFHAVDFALMAATHPDKVRALLAKVYQLTADGTLPLPEIAHYPLADAATAIRRIAGAQHTGKLVLDVSRSERNDVVVPPEQVPVFRGDGAYIITGGLGGLGLFLAEKMASGNGGAKGGQGCGRIVLTSRSQPTTKSAEIVELLRATGVDIAVECGDISAAGTAERLVAVATATGLPVRGVLHAAAVVEDATLTNITDELIEHDWAPKVYGAWNLHEATISEPLDWFCAFSSAAALVGSPGQGAYAAANSWLDAFMYWRRAQGLPGTAIAWGAWAQIGQGTALAEGAAAILPDEGAYAFETMLRYDRTYTGYTPILGVSWLAAFVERSPFAQLFRSTGQSSTEGRRLRTELAALPRDEWATQLRRLISEQVGLILRRAIDPDRQLSDYGLDSLGNLELRTRIEAETGVRISAMDISTVRALAEKLCDTIAADD